MTWIAVAVIFRVGMSCCSSVLQKKLVQRGSSESWILAFSLTTLTILASPWIAHEFPGLIESPPGFWKSIAVAIALDTIGNLLLVRAIGHGDLSLVGPLNSYKPLVGVALGTILLQEIPSWLGACGIATILLGSLVLFEPTPSKTHPVSSIHVKGVRDRFLSLLFTAIASLFLKQAIQQSNATITFSAWALGCTGFAWGIRLTFSRFNRVASEHVDDETYPTNDRNQAHSPRMTDRAYGVLLGMSFLVLQGLTLWLFARMPVGYALALFQLSSLIQVLIGWKFYREPNFVRRLFACMIMVAGAAMVLMG